VKLGDVLIHGFLWVVGNHQSPSNDIMTCRHTKTIYFAHFILKQHILPILAKITCLPPCSPLRYITYNAWLPQHAHYSAKILRLLTSYVSAQNDLLSSIVVSTALRQSILHGFVKCLEMDDDEEEGGETSSLTCKTKVTNVCLFVCLFFQQNS
jgi:Protein of unknown function (DUF3414).